MWGYDYNGLASSLSVVDPNWKIFESTMNRLRAIWGIGWTVDSEVAGGKTLAKLLTGAAACVNLLGFGLNIGNLETCQPNLICGDSVAVTRLWKSSPGEWIVKPQTVEGRINNTNQSLSSDGAGSESDIWSQQECALPSKRPQKLFYKVIKTTWYYFNM